MSDPNRATLITVGAPKIAKANVIKTVRLTINLDESNESKYPELNYKELVFAEERKLKVQNGKTPGLDPFSDNDDDVERVARKFEQKYGGKSTYCRKKARSKQDDFADIGAGYDENDSFIDNTDGYDEMIPPECDTLLGGFYINSGSLEFKTVPLDQADDEPNNRRDKRRISSSSSEESSESSSDSESGEEKDKALGNGDIQEHDTEHRKKKNKKSEKKKAKKVRRTDSSAATSGKQTSDENNQGDLESADCADSRTSHSDSLASKPAPSSENPLTSDSSRDMEAKADCKLPAPVSSALDTLEALVARSLLDSAAPATTPTQLLANSEPYLLRLEQALKTCNCDASTRRAAWARAATCIGVPRAKLHARAKHYKSDRTEDKDPQAPPTGAAATTTASTSTTTTEPQQITTASTTTTTVPVNNKRKHAESDDDYSKLTDEQREAIIVETLQRLKALIDERKPSMLANYNAECERVQEERKKLQIAQAAEGAPHVEKRLPKRRFPWCPKSRALLAKLRRLARDQQEASVLLAKRALPLFPNGFVRMPTLLRQAEVKEIKVTDVKRQRLGSTSQPAVTNVQTNQQTTPALPFTEPIQFPSSLTVTTTLKPTDKMETDTDDKYKTNSIFSSLRNNFALSKDLIVEKDDNSKKDDHYIPPNNIGSITITPVPNQTKEKKNSVIMDKAPSSSSTGLIRVKSPAALNDMVNKKDLKPIKKLEKSHSYPNSQFPIPKDKRVESPLHIDTSYQPIRKDPSPRDSNYKKDPSPKESNYKKDPSPRDSNYKKDPSPRDSNYKKDPSPKDLNYKKDPSPKDSNYKKDLTSKDPNYKKDPTTNDSSYKKDVNSKDLYRKDLIPKSKDEIPQKQIESMKIAENNIPRPALVPVQHSPTFAKPDKRPPEGKKKKDLILIPEVDPLSDLNEPVNVDDSSSDVEVIEDKQTDKSDSVVPSKDKVTVPKLKDGKDEESAEIDTLMKNLREMEHSQEPKFNSNSYSGVINSAKQGSSRCNSNKLTERTSLNKMDGSKTITG